MKLIILRNDVKRIKTERHKEREKTVSAESCESKILENKANLQIGSVSVLMSFQVLSF
jgi:hypothetical protein